MQDPESRQVAIVIWALTDRLGSPSKVCSKLSSCIQYGQVRVSNHHESFWIWSELSTSSATRLSLPQLSEMLVSSSQSLIRVSCFLTIQEREESKN